MMTSASSDADKDTFLTVDKTDDIDGDVESQAALSMSSPTKSKNKRKKKHRKARGNQLQMIGGNSTAVDISTDSEIDVKALSTSEIKSVNKPDLANGGSCDGGPSSCSGVSLTPVHQPTALSYSASESSLTTDQTNESLANTAVNTSINSSLDKEESSPTLVDKKQNQISEDGQKPHVRSPKISKDFNQRGRKSPSKTTTQLSPQLSTSHHGNKEQKEHRLPRVNPTEDQMKNFARILNLGDTAGGKSAPSTYEEAKKRSYKFWNTQPVPKIDASIPTEEMGCIEPDKPLEELRQTPYTLPPGFSWESMDLTKPEILNQVYTLLYENYVEDDDNMFRFDYSSDFLRWALFPPGWRREWHVGVRSDKSKTLLGFISAVPAHIRTYDHDQPMVEINYLCVHKKLRSKRLAPVLIKEVTRRVNVTGIFQAVYTAGVVLPKPVATCRYYHRSLNPKKLIEVRFSYLSHNMTMQRTIKLYRLPENTKIPGFRPMVKNDIPATHKLVTEYLKKFHLTPLFTEEEFAHWFTTREGIIHSFVVQEPPCKLRCSSTTTTTQRNNSSSGNKPQHHHFHDNTDSSIAQNQNADITDCDGAPVITDFVSFYVLPSTIMHHPTYKSLNAAYSFYNVAGKHAWKDLMTDTLIMAKKLNMDVFNALDVMENQEFLKELKFGQGDGHLQYYLYNFKCPSMEPKNVGLVLQ